ncbi:MAG: bifunctional 4-hydroxy-2-oxoglutarate aldolase/2-dehydro-3-deoxy-phosphogluconate aldolase [Verrucomicrobiota bacterium]|jgi:2-dehydro-3-deoxyphosphogluconate aldolase/(4S)-4-hydroxy-2-oxoglutarate aldolase
MSNKHSTIRRIVDSGIVAILRSPTGAKLIDAAKAIVSGGIPAIEVTMTTPGALNIIRDMKRALGDDVCMGVGSVLDTETARSALLAGAEYIVTPIVRPDVIQLAHRYGVPVLAGAMTPTEAFTAHELGADFIKLFPAENLGPSYVKALLAPLPALQIIPTGGVTPENIGDYIKAGCPAVGAGSQLAQKELIDNGDFPKITKLAAKYVAALKKARG